MNNKKNTLASNILRSFTCLLISSAISAFAVFVTDAVVTKWYLFSTGVNSLHELSDDYGFAMLLVFWYAVAFIISFAITFLISWKRLSHK